MNKLQANPQDFVLNTHLFPTVNPDTGNLVPNTKAGWQSSKTTSATQSNIKSTIEVVRDWIADGTIKDGDIITTHTQVTFTSAKEAMVTEGLMVNGKAVTMPDPATEAPADKAAAPF